MPVAVRAAHMAAVAGEVAAELGGRDEPEMWHQVRRQSVNERKAAGEPARRRQRQAETGVQVPDAIEAIEDITGQTLDVLHIVGGGIQNELLCQFAANAIGRKVVTGPIEATASGNILMQAIATGQLKSIEEARQVVRNSFDLKTYTPQDAALWAQKYEHFRDR